MVDVEQRALRALEQDALAGAAQVVQQLVGRRHIGQHLRRRRHQFVLDRRRRRRRQAHAAPQRLVMGEQARDLAVERFGLGEIHQPNGAPADLVFVGRADAALGGADLHAAEVRRFAKRVEFPMQRENQRDVFGNLEVIWRHFHAKGANFVDFIDQMVRIEHDAVADHRQLARPHDARRQKRKLVGLAVDHQGVAGVVAALETHHHVGGHRQPVDDLALTLVAPLSADNHHVRHRRTIPRVPKWQKPRRQRQWAGPGLIARMDYAIATAE